MQNTGPRESGRQTTELILNLAAVRVILGGNNGGLKGTYGEKGRGNCGFRCGEELLTFNIE